MYLNIWFLVGRTVLGRIRICELFGRAVLSRPAPVSSSSSSFSFFFCLFLSRSLLCALSLSLSSYSHSLSLFPSLLSCIQLYISSQLQFKSYNSLPDVTLPTISINKSYWQCKLASCYPFFCSLSWPLCCITTIQKLLRQERRVHFDF